MKAIDGSISPSASPSIECFSPIDVRWDRTTESALVRFVSARLLVPEVTLLAADAEGSPGTPIASVFPILRGRRHRHELSFPGVESGRSYSVVVRGGGVPPSVVRFDA